MVDDKDLYRTDKEADVVRDALAGAGYEPVLVLRGREATREAVLAHLERPDVELFHYAGHSVREGVDAWDSFLSLDGGQRLTIGDVLRLRHVPRRVILSSCATDASGDGGFVAGLAIAPAFVIAGADLAVAAAGDENGGAMKILMSSFYRTHPPRPLDDDPAAVAKGIHDAMLGLGVGPRALQLRVLVP
jgi:CHAT domain-containing protein